MTQQSEQRLATDANVENNISAACLFGQEGKMTKTHDVSESTKRTIRWLMIVVLFAISFTLRLEVIDQTEISVPIRADARDYYSYALNLKYFSVFSRRPFDGSASAPKPDAVRAPGYPALLFGLVDYPPTQAMLWIVYLVQAVLDSLTVVILFLIGRSILPLGLSMFPALLCAFSPHLISAVTYLLSETLFTFLMMLGLWATLRAVRSTISWSLLAGILLAAATLTRPVLQYFVLPLVALVASRRPPRFLVTALVLFLAMSIPLGLWAYRNHTAIGHTSDPTLIIGTLHHGMYPNFEFQGDPASRGFPYRFDPRSAEISHSIESVLAEITTRFRTEPARHFKWYLIDKPKMLLSWDIVQGMGDVFIYQAIQSPYLKNGFYKMTHSLMKWLHWPLVVLALIGAVMVWVPRLSRQFFSTQGLLAAQVLSLALGYFIALHIIAAPFPRYGIPLRPLIYLLAMFPLLPFQRHLPFFANRGSQP